MGSPEHHYQFGGSLIKSKNLSTLLKPAHQTKSPDEIKKELESKKRAWDIKFLGNVKKLISINYLIEISFF